MIVYQTAEFEMAEQYFQENIVPMLCSNLNGDVVCVMEKNRSYDGSLAISDKNTVIAAVESDAWKRCADQ